MCAGDFTPVSPRTYGRYYQLGNDATTEVAHAIVTGAHATICINDGELSDFEHARTTINEALVALLPRPSSFELG